MLKQLKKKSILISMLLILIMTFGLVGCSSNETGEIAKETSEVKGEEAFTEVMTAGTYTGKGRGRNGEMTVEVEVSDSEILSVKLLDHKETSRVATIAEVDMSEKIVLGQSLSVDATSGATLTAYGILNGVKDAMKTAGINPEIFIDKEMGGSKEEKPRDAKIQEYDVVIVGAGASGLGAATELGRNYPDLSVLVLEKTAFTGGDFSFSGGGISVGGSKYNREIGMDVTPDKIANFFEMRSGEQAKYIVEGLSTNAFSIWGELFDYLIDQGFPLTTKKAVVSWDMDATENAFQATDDESGGTFEIIENTGKPENIRSGVLMFQHPELRSPESAQDLAASLTAIAENLGVEIRVNSKVVELIEEDGAVMGVIVEGSDTTYQVNASKVILATGNINRNKDLLEKYMPIVNKEVVRASAGQTGDAFLLTEKLNTVVTGYGQNSMSCIDEIRAYDTAIGTAYARSSIWVNKEGKRFCDEKGHIYNVSLDIAEQTDGLVYNIYDSQSEIVNLLEESLGDKVAYKADTLEELAETLGVDKEAFFATIEKYNADYEVGEDPLFGLTKNEMTPIKEGPFYATPMRCLNLGVMVSLKCNNTGALVNSEGEVIPNLFGAGYVVIGNLYGNRAPSSGLNIASSISTGALSAQTVAKEIMAEQQKQ